MKQGMMGKLALGFMLGVAGLPFCLRADAASSTFVGPVELQVDNLKNPLGIDDGKPRFSWQLNDAAQGARQTAYEVQVASSEGLLQQDKADVWDSGRVESSQSLNVAYGGTGGCSRVRATSGG